MRYTVVISLRPGLSRLALLSLSLSLELIIFRQLNSRVRPMQIRRQETRRKSPVLRNRADAEGPTPPAKFTETPTNSVSGNFLADARARAYNILHIILVTFKLTYLPGYSLCHELKKSSSRLKIVDDKKIYRY